MHSWLSYLVFTPFSKIFNNPKQRSYCFLHLYIKTHQKLLTIQLIEDCKKGKPQALRKLFESYSGYMFRVCLRYMKNTEDAEDMLSQGFSKVFQNLTKFEYRDEISLKAWIKKAMIFECLMHLRKQHNFIMMSENEIEEAVYTDEIIEGFEANYIFTEIANLPVGYRTVLNLYCIEGYKHQEIAQILNIKENTSRSQLNKAKKLLKERLAANNKKDERKRF